MKILVIRFSSIGDIVLTTPVVRCLKLQKPGVVIHYLTKDSFRPVTAGNPYIDKFHYLKNSISDVIKELRAENFDCIIDLHNNFRSLRIKDALDIKSYTFNKLNLRKWLLVNFKVNLLPDKSIVERYFKTVKSLGVKNDGQGLDYFVPAEDVLKNSDLPMSHWAGYVGCVIGGSYNTKKLPADKWKEFIQQVPFPVILLGGPEDRDLGQLIAATDPIKIYNSCGKFNLNESAFMVEKARVIVSNDTGLMHIAAAFKKPVISLWGNTASSMGMFPYYGYNNIKSMVASQSIIMENRKLYCHPCSKLGFESCPEKHFNCMNQLDMHELSKYVEKFWNMPQR
jgi:ADP-heptose:LPS heptosyltransferase